ncbi:hypothetical protein CONPUDRAFT_84939 [Coniophora puteana RWD-64-598 SS2]|uniref:Uncharacterized protein n=1 Tax=Coniophora puteana (strain RWD-64-598) TaxID=741705 RepID=A0A5M3MAN3_CONPW|nr:uncharacterized protein CONPUDRAFT_84939 [Coniophora puteana RWD-64-598 SS2]EIW76328.1 hypothetical protein CONPUDRAFT_84939 [Coniophora puteana RWD-64-598 SS2]
MNVVTEKASFSTLADPEGSRGPYMHRHSPRAANREEILENGWIESSRRITGRLTRATRTQEHITSLTLRHPEQPMREVHSGKLINRRASRRRYRQGEAMDSPIAEPQCPF